MKKTQGKFVLFDLDGFAEWLESARISRVIRLVQNHHTWSPSYKHFDGNNHFKLLSGMEHSHIERGFAEIAQNLTTFPDGTLALCRSLDKIPAGIKGANTGGICIEHVGNFDVGGDAMTAAHRDTIVKLNALLCRKFRLATNSSTIVYHHWYDLVTGERKNGAGSTKTCPGTNFFGGNTVAAAEANFIPLVAAALTGGTVPAGTPASSPTAAILFRGTVSSDTLNVRTQPNASAKVVKVLGRGILVNAYEEKGGWCRVDPTESYWVNARYVTRMAAAETPADAHA